MTPKIVMHPLTDRSVQQCIEKPPHAVLLVGPTGSGKVSVAHNLGREILGIQQAEYERYPYIVQISSTDGKAISIDAVRSMQGQLSLKIPTRSGSITRLVLIENAHLLTIEAQNAMLKTLEEPPQDTVILMTASSPEALLTTIRSRVRIVPVHRPSLESLRDHFVAQGFQDGDIDRAVMVSGGLPGLTYALLTDPEKHPLYEATAQARILLQATAYQRLCMVDSLSKQRELCIDTLFIMGQMARMALLKNVAMPAKAAQRWQDILRASYDTTLAIRSNAQLKLSLTNLMLSL